MNDKPSRYGEKDPTGTVQSPINVKVIGQNGVNWAKDTSLQELIDISGHSNDILRKMAQEQGLDVKQFQESVKVEKAGLKNIKDTIESGNVDRRKYEKEYSSSIKDLESSLSNVSKSLKYGLSGIASSFHNASPERFFSGLAEVAGGVFSSGLFKKLGPVGEAVEGLGAAAIGATVAIAEISINLTKQFQTLSDTGNNFNGSMDDLMSNANQLGLSFDNVSQLLTKYSALSVAVGDKQMTQGILFGKTLEQSTNIATSYNMSVSDLLDAQASLGDSMNTLGGMVGKSFKDLGPAVGDYLDNLNAVSALTGQSRKQLEEQHQALMQSERTKLEFLTLSTQQQDNISKSTANLPPQLAQMVVDAAVAQIKGTPALMDPATRQLSANSAEFRSGVTGAINGDTNAGAKLAISAADYVNQNAALLSAQALYAPDGPVGQLGKALVDSIDSNGWQNFTKQLKDGADGMALFTAAAAANKPKGDTATNEAKAELLQAQLNQAQNDLQQKAFDLGSKVLPVLTTVLGGLTDTLNKLIATAPTIQKDASSLIENATQHPLIAAGVASLVAPILLGGKSLVTGGIRSAAGGIGSLLFGGGGAAAGGGSVAGGGGAAAGGGILGGALLPVLAGAGLAAALDPQTYSSSFAEGLKVLSHPGQAFNLFTGDKNKADFKDLTPDGKNIFGQQDNAPAASAATPIIQTINPNTYMSAALDYFKKSHMYYSDSMALWNDIHAQLVKLTGVTGDEMTKLQYNVKRLGNSVY